MPLPDKPKYATPCNHCGQCCSLQLCPIGEMAFPGVPAPCPALVVENDKALCNLVKIEEMAGMEPMFRQTLGIGCGCSMPDEDTTEADVAELERVSIIKIHTMQPRHVK